MGTIFRMHSNPGFGRQPWNYGAQAEKITRNFLHMRMSFMPMLIAAGRKSTEDGTPIVRRLDLEFPDHVEATASDQYLLGDDLLVAPVDPWADGAKAPNFNRKRTVWLPPGLWEDAFTGNVIHGPLTQAIESTVETIPLFHRRPGILLCADPTALNVRAQDWSRIFVEAFPGSAGSEAKRFLHDTRADVLLVGAQDGQKSPPHSQVQIRTSEAGKTEVYINCLASEQAQSTCAREWVVRLHLRAGEVPTQAHADGITLRGEGDRGFENYRKSAPFARLIEPSAAANSSRVYGKAGAAPAPLAGAVLEVTFPSDQNLKSRHLEVYVAGVVEPGLKLPLAETFI